MIKITRRQVLQLFDELDIKLPSPELIPYLQRFAQVAFVKWGYPQWHPIDTAPSDGRFFLAVNISDPSSMMVVNWPVGCHPGKWYYDKRLKEWFGSAFIDKKWAGHCKSDHSRQQNSFTHWTELPNPPSNTADNIKVLS